jgi:hypothetical protein
MFQCQISLIENIYTNSQDRNHICMKAKTFETILAPSIRKTLALTSLTKGGRSVGIVRLRTEATESLVLGGLYIET